MTETAPRRTEYMPLDQLTPDPANPKAHDMESLDASVGRFGFVESITVDERTGHIVAGHGRHRALVEMRERGDSPPEGVTVSPEGAWLVPVLRGWASRTDAEARAYLIASNRVSELGGWVDDALLDALDSLDGELSGVGFEADSIEDLRARLKAEDLVDSFLGAPEQGDGAGDGEGSDLGTLTIAGPMREIVVVVPEERYEDFYALMHETEWIKDVRDRT